MMGEAVELVELDQDSIFREDCLKVGKAYEKYVTDNSAELIATSKQMTQYDKYGPAPLLENGTVNPWPDNGLWEYSVIALTIEKQQRREEQGEQQQQP